MLTKNMFGDINSDLAAGTRRRHGNGSLGRHQGNLRRIPASPRFGAGHRRQRDANLIATVLSVAMMLEWLGTADTRAGAEVVRTAVR
jgi:isocitrate/isopropylmalate dehydrogenase